MARGSYQLWDLTTGNCVGAYDDEPAALAEVRAGVTEDGPDSFDGIALLRAGDSPEEIEPIADGDALVYRAFATWEIEIAGDALSASTPKASVLLPTNATGAAAALTVGTSLDALTNMLRLASPPPLSEMVLKSFGSAAFSDRLMQAASVTSFSEALARAADTSALTQAALAAFTQPIFAESARTLQAAVGALAFGDALRNFPTASGAIAALVAAGRVEMSVGPEESVLAFPATDEILDSLVAEGAIASVEARETPPRVVRLRVSRTLTLFELDPPDEYRAAGD